MEQTRLTSLISSESPGAIPGLATAATLGETGLSYGLGREFDSRRRDWGVAQLAERRPLKPRQHRFDPGLPNHSTGLVVW